MKTKTKFDSTSDARNLINSVIEKFPKGPERDGLQTKLREFYNCFVGAMRLPQGYDRSKVIEEGTQNLHAAQRIADRIDKQNGNAKFSTMISILASNLTDLKRDHSKTGKIEDNFYGKRVVKGIFAKVNISSQINAAKQLGVQMARENKSSEYGDSRWNTLLNETYKMVGGENTDQGSNVSKQLREAWKSANEKEQGRIKKIQQDASFKLEAVVRSLKSKLESKGFCSNNKNCSPQDKALQQEIGEAFSYETSDQQFISLIRKMTARLGQPFGVASKNRRRGVKAIFAATKEQTINEIRGLKILIQTYENQLKSYKNLLKSALKYLKTLGEGEETFFRTGSKAKFDNEEIAMGLSKVLKIHGFNAMASEVLSGSTDSETLRKYIRALKSKMSPMSGNDRGMVLLQTLEKQLASRTGVKAKFAKAWSGKSAKLNKYGDYAIVAADADGNAKGFANRTQAQNFSDSNNLGGVKDPSGGGRSFYVYIKDPSSEEKKTLSRTGAKVFK